MVADIRAFAIIVGVPGAVKNAAPRATRPLFHRYKPSFELTVRSFFLCRLRLFRGWL